MSIEDYKKNMQMAKVVIFQILLDKNNQFMSRREIEEQFRMRGEQQNIHIPVRDAIEDSMSSDNPNDVYKIVANREVMQIADNTGIKYRLKTENIQNKDQLEEFLREKKCILHVNSVWFESCYPNMKEDLERLVSESKLFVKDGRDKKKIYIYMDSLFRNYQEQLLFKSDPIIRTMLEQAKSQNISTLYQEKCANQTQSQKVENVRRPALIQNSWIQGLQQELQKR